MIDAADAWAACEQAGLRFWTGVPDSLLAELSASIEAHAEGGSHVIAANEGGAVAIALGRHLATGEVCGVYLQNSGLGNAVNPLVSLADPAVYGIPLVLVIGWRGEPGTRDEPQHRRQGETTLDLLRTLGVPTRVAGDDLRTFEDDVSWAVTTGSERAGPVALVVRAGTFTAGLSAPEPAPAELPFREDALAALVGALPGDAAVVATTGKTSRELYELRDRSGAPQRDFLTIGGMGHASQIALGVALAKPGRRVCALDGDGALVMHMGSLAVIGQHAPPNLLHVVLHNGAHESVGGQPTPTERLDVAALALAAGYRRADTVDRLDAIAEAVSALCAEDGPTLLEVRIRQGSRPDLGRPEDAPSVMRERFMSWLGR